jgi:PST family polysaccharide transporter
MVGRQTAFSGSLMVAARLISRFIDLFSMLVLARLLSPSDFGLVAIAMTIALIVEAALEMPLSESLVRLPVITDAHYNTAFTIAFIRAICICIIICGLSVPFALFYHQPGLVKLICVLSLAPAARGFLNPRFALYAKNLNFKYEFVCELSGKSGAFVAGVTTAFLTHSYWSIAACTITSPLIIASLSYVLRPFRPRLTLSEWRVFSGFLGWISLSQVILAINWQSDQLLLGKFVRTAQLGLFTTATSISNIPMLALFSPIQRPLLSAFTMLKEEPDRLVSGYRSAAAAIVTIGLPLMIGQSLVAEPTIRLLLGPKWLGATYMLFWLSFSLIPCLFGMLLTPLSMAMNETQALFWRNLAQMCVKLPMVVVGAVFYGFAGVIAARIVSEVFMSLYCMLIIRQTIAISVFDQFTSCWRSFAAAGAMALILVALNRSVAWGTSPLDAGVQLAVMVSSGAAVYGAVLASLWMAVGRPAGIEAKVWGILSAVRGRFGKVAGVRRVV